MRNYREFLLWTEKGLRTESKQSLNGHFSEELLVAYTWDYYRDKIYSTSSSITWRKY